jgi:amino-acid N-acetyltransferase
MDSIITPATPDDSRDIFNILTPYVDQGIILERPLDEIDESIETFLVARREGNIEGVVSYHDYGDGLYEIRSLAVKREITGSGTGTHLMKAMIEHLIEKGGRRIFSLTYSPAFFHRLGFLETPKDSLPEKIWKDCSKCRNRDVCGETALLYGFPDKTP